LDGGDHIEDGGVLVPAVEQLGLALFGAVEFLGLDEV
jgi:hypothetical protein